MEFFKPTHCNSLFEATDIGIFITFDGHIVLTNGIKDKLTSKKLEELGELDDNIIKYNIMHDDHIINYSDLILIDNAISVCKISKGYVILLNTGKLLYIFDSNYIEYILYIIDKLNNISVEYITNNNEEGLLYSNNKLYVIFEVWCEGVEDFEIAVYDDVIGYLAEHNILLILYSNLKLQNVGRKIYRIKCRNTIDTDSFEDKYFVNTNNDNLLDAVIINDIKCICIQVDEIYMIVKSSIIGWVHHFKPNYKEVFYDNIKFLTNIKEIDFIGSFQFCLLEDNTLLVGDALHSYTLNSCLDVINYLVVDSSVVCMHSDDTISVINMKCDEDINRHKLNEFLVDPINFDRISKIKKILSYSHTNHYLVYVTYSNIIEILNIITLELVNLNVFLGAGDESKYLHLKKYNEFTYI